MIAFGSRASISATGVVCGTISEYTRASRTRRAMSWAYWAPKSTTRTRSWSVVTARSLAAENFLAFSPGGRNSPAVTSLSGRVPGADSLPGWAPDHQVCALLAGAWTGQGPVPLPPDRALDHFWAPHRVRRRRRSGAAGQPGRRRARGGGGGPPPPPPPPP